ncbi:hypothetical protein B0O99DRAFT_596037 [Bisporella sp. PMI_857]|nr:hypothetical protein B0O99DRAFT_596037 [Bisporella sp. PMI_857]
MAAHDLEELDLHDISLLLNYERAISDPKFKDTKLEEVAVSVGDVPFSTLPEFKALGWGIQKECVGYLFVQEEDLLDSENRSPDTPENMLPNPIPESLKGRSRYDLETIYWQARGYDSCYTSITLLRFFLDNFPDT